MALKNNKEIKRLENISLSNRDVLKIVDGKANFVTYDKIKDYDNIDDLLDPYGSCIILYLSSDNYGHFCCLNFVGDGSLEFFDPYQGLPDSELTKFKLTKKKREELGQDYPYLLKLMYDSPYELSYNQYPFQKHKNEIKTCGRHCAVRTLLKYLPLDEYAEIMRNNDLGTPDEIVTALTTDIG